MELKDILAISGQPGLYKYLATNSSGVIVESLTDKKRTLFPSNSKVSALVEIAIFTDGEEMPLADVFTKLYAQTSGKETISAKSTPEEMKKLLAAIVPNYDTERVHVSDIKKIISWFNILVGCGMKEFKLPEQEEAEQADGAATKTTKEAKPAKEGAAKPAAKATPKAKAGGGASAAAKGASKAQRPRPKV